MYVWMYVCVCVCVCVCVYIYIMQIFKRLNSSNFLFCVNTAAQETKQNSSVYTLYRQMM